MILKLLVLLIFVSLLSKTCRSSPAKPLLRFDEENGNFTLSEDALSEIQTLIGPVRIVGAIGDARVGKSTNLNFIRYFLEGERNQRVEKVFDTSDGMRPCTTRVWMSVSRDSNGDGSTILLDTEGTNLGDNENTDLLSIFTMMMSSGLALFAREGVQNHNVQFLYRVSRLSEQIWKDDAESIKAFPQLLVIIRNALALPQVKLCRVKLKILYLMEITEKPLQSTFLELTLRFETFPSWTRNDCVTWKHFRVMITQMSHPL